MIIARRPQPIKPEEVVSGKALSLPPDVIEVFNLLISLRWDGRCSKVTQEDLVTELVQRGHNRRIIFENGWLDIEDLYRKVGWKVEYEKPGYNGSGEAFFAFSKGK